MPKYQDADESDVFILSAAEDLVQVLLENGGKWEREVLPPRMVGGPRPGFVPGARKSSRIQRYRPRIEGLFGRIERWTNETDSGDSPLQRLLLHSRGRSKMPRTKVFVSYSHDDREWLSKFSLHVAILERRGLVELWSDEGIAAGADWEREIEIALGAAKVAVLMVSPAFLASEYIWKHEMPRIVAHSRQGMVALPLILRPCAWRLEEDLARLQARPTDGRPLSLGSESEIDLNLSELAYELAARVGKSPTAIAPPDVAANASANGPVSNPRKVEPFTGSAE